MLQQLREKTKSIVSIVMLLLLIVSFGIWGIEDMFRQSGVKDWVAKVGPMKISPQVLDREFQNQSAQMRSMLGANFSAQRAKEAGLMERALNSLIAYATMELETNRLGLRVGNEPIVAMLGNTKELRGADGTFDRNVFQQVLRNQGINEAMFLDQQRKLMARNILVRSLALPVYVPEIARDDFAKATAQRRIAEVVKVNMNSVSIPAATEEQLKAYFDAHPDNYKSTEKRSFTALTLKPSDLGKDIAITPEEVKAYYEQNKAQFEHTEKRDLIQVVLDTEEKAKALFDAAQKSGLPQAAKEQGVDAVSLDQMPQKDLPDTLGTAVFAKGVSQLGGPVKSNLGWHVFVVEKITPGRKQGFEEVQATLKTKLQSDKAAESLVQTANKVDDMLAGGKSLEDIAQTFNLTIQKFEDREKAGDKTVSPEMLKAAFAQNEGETSPLMENKDGGGYVLVRVDKVKSSSSEDFTAMKDKVKEDWTKAEKAKKATQVIEKVAEQMRKGDALSALSGEGLSKSTSQPVRMDEWQNAGVPREALSPLFNMGKGEVAVVSTAEGDIAVRVKSIQAGSAKDVENRKAALKDNVERQWLAQHLEELGEALKQEYPVKIDERGLQTLMASETN